MTNSIESIKGIIYGGAIGDALGLATEFMTIDDVKKFYPNIKRYTYNCIIRDYHRSTWENGDWTDDTDFTIILMKSIIEKKKFDLNDYSLKMIDYIDNGLKECGDTKGHGIGNTFSIWWGDKYSKSNPQLAGLRSFIYNPFYPMSNQSNGGIMKTSILAALDYQNFNKVVQNTIDMCSITHPSPVCVYSCIILNYILVNLITSQERSTNFILNIILNSIKDTKIYIEKYIEKLKIMIDEIPINLDKNDPMRNIIIEILNTEKKKFFEINNVDKICSSIENILYSNNINIYDMLVNQGDTLKPLACAICSLRYALMGKNFDEILTMIINRGGDADTNCTVAGSVLGAFFGKTQIPKDYIDNLKYLNLLEKYTNEFIEVISK
jgi:ADP-ribosylglycohydrolase